MILDQIRNIKSEKNDLRKFGIVIGITLGLLSLLLFILRRDDVYIYIIPISVFMLISGLFFPKILWPFHKVWMSISILLGSLVSFIVLFVFYFAVFTPASILSKIFRVRNLDTKIIKSEKSYWIPRKCSENSIEDYEKQF